MRMVVFESRSTSFAFWLYCWNSQTVPLAQHINTPKSACTHRDTDGYIHMHTSGWMCTYNVCVLTQCVHVNSQMHAICTCIHTYARNKQKHKSHKKNRSWEEREDVSKASLNAFQHHQDLPLIFSFQFSHHQLPHQSNLLQVPCTQAVSSSPDSNFLFPLGLNYHGISLLIKLQVGSTGKQGGW